jgi:hypothetical protein
VINLEVGELPMERERKVLFALVILLAVLWVGFVVHRAPRFPGSFAGGVLAMSGAALMVLFSLAYMVVKRIPAVKQRVSEHVSMGQLLTWHVYTGAIGAILAILHTGHRFESDLGILLTASMLVAVLSGFVGRHLIALSSVELREKQRELEKLETSYNEVVRERFHQAGSSEALTDDPALDQSRKSFPFRSQPLRASVYRAVQITDAVADLEYSIKNHQRFKRLASVWLKAHIGFSLAFYLLLGLHVWSSIHFGLRWFD